MRNAVYHIGTLLPTKKDVESAIELARSLFNELHPQVEFEKVHVTLPSKETINMLTNAMGSQPYITELTIIRKFSDYLMKQGYKVLIEYAFRTEGYRYRPDMIAMKGERVIVFEFKRKLRKNMIMRVIDMLKKYMTLTEAEFPNTKVEGWLINYGGDFLLADEKVAKRFNIKLIGSQRFKEFFKNFNPNSD